ncbi:MAG: type IV secretion system protein VirB10, partial [Desulfobaccales bacterium]
MIARLHGQYAGTTALILPDGQLGIPNMLVPANEPFQPFTAEELLARLQKGPLGDFQVHQTAHYLIFYQSSRAFAEASGRRLEDLYRRLLDAFRKQEKPVHDTEFP